MRPEVTRDRLRALLREISDAAPGPGPYRVYLVGGGTAVYSGWRPSSVDADLYSEQEEVFRRIQEIKERLNINVEFARPEHFVPALPGTEDRHVFIERIGAVDFFHYDPYAQVLAKVVRGFRRDLDDAGHFVRDGMVDPDTLRELVGSIPEDAYNRYPALSPSAVVGAVRDFTATVS
jgi:Nucleotidyltransferase of unknown function (DUF6036)